MQLNMKKHVLKMVNTLQNLLMNMVLKVKSFNDDVWDSFGEAAAEVFEETRNHSALAKK